MGSNTLGTGLEPQLKAQSLPPKQMWNAAQSDVSGTIEGLEPTLTCSQTLSAEVDVKNSPTIYKTH